ncbi:MAG TPA: hydrogenase 2 operon protein HybA [Thermoanaerobaculia bacterium]|nr:hydrogenase 2 operon protein HybA [Thermoanaerobaculia bacterium]
MATDRRTLLKGLAAAATITVIPRASEARQKPVVPSDAVGLLYDSTKCIGCKACVVKCKEIAKLEADVDGYGDGLYDAPEGLNEYARNVIQLAKDGEQFAYVKKQCMHCVDPACATACMMGALHKGENGIVTWEANKCIGCRYCQVACPFNVPKFQWAKVSPRLIKCDLCKARLAEGKQPGCVEVCPRAAVIYGKRDELLREAHKRIDQKPDLYVNKVYGEKELGGTQVLYLSHIPFESLGFRFKQEESSGNLQQTVQHGVYKGFIAPLALYGLLGAVMFRNRKKGDANDDVR